PEPLRGRPEHGQRSAGRGRGRASCQGRLLAGSVPRANQLRRGGAGDGNVDACISGGDAMIRNKIALMLLLVLTACSGEKPTPAPAPEVVRDVTLLTAEKTMVPDYSEATGTVRASQSAQLSSQVMGTITRVNVHEGDRVRRGEVLIAIDEAQQRAAYAGANAGLQVSQESIAAADADYALAESTMKRYQMLYDKKSVSPQEFDEVKNKLAAAKARRDAA